MRNSSGDIRPEQNWGHKCHCALPLTIFVTFCNISVVKGSRIGNVNAFQAISTSSNKAERLLTWLIETVLSSPSTASHCSMYFDNSGSLKNEEIFCMIYSQVSNRSTCSLNYFETFFHPVCSY